MKESHNKPKWSLVLAEAQRMAVSEMPEAFSLSEIIYDEGGRAVDARLLEVNPAFTRVTGLAADAVVGKRVAEVLPGIRKWVERYEPVVQTGLPMRFEQHDEERGRTFEVTAFRPREGQFGCVFQDVTERRRGEETIRREQARHEALVRTSLDGYAVLDLEGRILRVNEAYCEMFGYTPGELLGRRAQDLDGVQSAAEREQHVARILELGRDRFETKIRRKQGGLVDVEVSVTVLPEEGEMLVFVRDISQRRRMESDREDMLRLLQLLNQPGETEELARALTVFLRQWSGCEAVGIWLQRGNECQSYRMWDVEVDEVAAGRHRCEMWEEPEGCLCGALLSGDEARLQAAAEAGSVWTNDLGGARNCAGRALPKHPGKNRAREGYRSLAVVPLKAGRRAIGLMRIADRRAGRVDADKIAFLEQAGASIAIGLEQRAAQAALRESEERFRAIADHTVEWENWFDWEGRLLWVNPAAERVTGYTPEECHGMEGYPLCLVHEGDLEGMRQALAAALEGNRADDVEFRIRHRNGEERWCAISCVPIYGAEGRPLGHRSSIRDISARKRARSVLETRVRLAGYARSHSLAELLEQVVNEAERLTKSKIGFMCFVEDEEEVVRLAACSAKTRAVTARGVKLGERQEVAGSGVWTDCLRERRAVIHNDYLALRHRKGLPEGHAQVHRELVAPAFRGQRIVALLGVGNKQTDYDERDSETVSQLADFAWDIVEWKRTEEARQASERNYRELVERLPLGTIVHREGRVEYMNAAAARMLGAGPEAVGEQLTRFGVEVEEDGTTREGRWKAADGRAFDVEWTAARVQYEGRDAVHVVFRDITQTKVLEQQFIQAQKIESLGRLAGGVAHDFNNLLTVINGYSQLLLAEKKRGPDQRTAIEQIHKAGERAAHLVGQMLAFSRKQRQRQEVLSPDEVIGGVTRMLERLLGENIEVRVELAAEGERVKADRALLEQVVLNLAVNARDAMPEGGVLSVSTGAAEMEGGECRICGGEWSAGRWVRIAVQDTGMGMDRETKEHLFEPFFTTKEPGKGTGLGLAMVHGTVMQSGGHIHVSTERGQGTRFEIYLQAENGGGVGTKETEEEGDYSGQELILLVEDQAGVREYAAEVLRGFGYEVVAAADAKEALKLARRTEFALLVTDVVMPRMSGVELARRMRAKRSGLKILFISSYPGNELQDGPGGGLPEGYLEKPFSPQALGRAVRERLDGR